MTRSSRAQGCRANTRVLVLYVDMDMGLFMQYKPPGIFGGYYTSPTHSPARGGNRSGLTRRPPCCGWSATPAGQTSCTWCGSMNELVYCVMVVWDKLRESARKRGKADKSVLF